MAVMPFIPPECTWLYTVLVGQNWPAGDEDALYRCAQAWQDALTQTLELAGYGDSTAEGVGTTIESLSADHFDTFWNQFTQGDNSALISLARQCAVQQLSLTGQSNEVEYTKLSIDITIVLIAIQIIWALAAAAFTLGGSLAEIPLATFFGQRAVLMLAERFLQMVLMMVLPDVISQGLMLRTGHYSWDGGKTWSAVESGVIAGLLGMVGGAAVAKLPFMGEEFGKTLGGRVVQGLVHFGEGGTVNTVTGITTGLLSGQQLDAAKLWGQFMSGGVLATVFYLPHLAVPHGTPLSFTASDGGRYQVVLNDRALGQFAGNDHQLPNGFTAPVYNESGLKIGTATFDGTTVSLDRMLGGSNTVDLTAHGFSLAGHDGSVTSYGFNDQGKPELTSYIQPSDGHVTITATDGSTVTVPEGSMVHYAADGNQFTADQAPAGGTPYRADIVTGDTVKVWQTATPGQDFQVTGQAMHANPLGLPKFFGLDPAKFYGPDGADGRLLGTASALTGKTSYADPVGYQQAFGDHYNPAAQNGYTALGGGPSAPVTATAANDPSSPAAVAAGQVTGHDAGTLGLPQTTVDGTGSQQEAQDQQSQAAAASLVATTLTAGHIQAAALDGTGQAEFPAVGEQTAGQAAESAGVQAPEVGKSWWARLRELVTGSPAETPGDPGSVIDQVPRYWPKDWPQQANPDDRLWYQAESADGARQGYWNNLPPPDYGGSSNQDLRYFGQVVPAEYIDPSTGQPVLITNLSDLPPADWQRLITSVDKLASLYRREFAVVDWNTAEPGTDVRLVLGGETQVNTVKPAIIHWHPFGAAGAEGISGGDQENAWAGTRFWAYTRYHSDLPGEPWSTNLYDGTGIDQAVGTSIADIAIPPVKPADLAHAQAQLDYLNEASRQADRAMVWADKVTEDSWPLGYGGLDRTRQQIQFLLDGWPDAPEVAYTGNREVLQDALARLVRVEELVRVGRDPTRAEELPTPAVAAEMRHVVTYLSGVDKALATRIDDLRRTVMARTPTEPLPGDGGPDQPGHDQAGQAPPPAGGTGGTGGAGSSPLAPGLRTPGQDDALLHAGSALHVVDDQGNPVPDWRTLLRAQIATYAHDPYARGVMDLAGGKVVLPDGTVQDVYWRVSWAPEVNGSTVVVDRFSVYPAPVEIVDGRPEFGDDLSQVLQSNLDPADHRAIRGILVQELKQAGFTDGWIRMSRPTHPERWRWIHLFGPGDRPTFLDPRIAGWSDGPQPPRPGMPQPPPPGSLPPESQPPESQPPESPQHESPPPGLQPPGGPPSGQAPAHPQSAILRALTGQDNASAGHPAGRVFADTAEGMAYGEQTWQAAAASLTPEQRAAVLAYTDATIASASGLSSSQAINRALRGRIPFTPEIEASIANIDQALRGQPVTESIVVNRDTNLRAFSYPEAGPGTAPDPMSLKGTVQSSPDYLSTHDPMSLEGTVQSSAAYLSTHLGAYHYGMEEVALHLTVPEGTPALYVGTFAYNPNEHELLLARGLSYQVDNVWFDETWHVSAHVIGAPDVPAGTMGGDRPAPLPRPPGAPDPQLNQAPGPEARQGTGSPGTTPAQPPGGPGAAAAWESANVIDQVPKAWPEGWPTAHTVAANDRHWDMPSAGAEADQGARPGHWGNLPPPSFADPMNKYAEYVDQVVPAEYVDPATGQRVVVTNISDLPPAQWQRLISSVDKLASLYRREFAVVDWNTAEPGTDVRLVMGGETRVATGGKPALIHWHPFGDDMAGAMPSRGDHANVEAGTRMWGYIRYHSDVPDQPWITKRYYSAITDPVEITSIAEIDIPPLRPGGDTLRWAETQLDSLTAGLRSAGGAEYWAGHVQEGHWPVTPEGQIDRAGLEQVNQQIRNVLRPSPDTAELSYSGNREVLQEALARLNRVEELLASGQVPAQPADLPTALIAEEMHRLSGHLAQVGDAIFARVESLQETIIDRLAGGTEHGALTGHETAGPGLAHNSPAEVGLGNGQVHSGGAQPAAPDYLQAAASPQVDITRITPAPHWRTDPEPVYRFEDRPPEEIFGEGFKPLDVNGQYDIPSYLLHNEDSPYVSTTRDAALGSGPRGFEYDPYRYEIDAPYGVDVAATLGEPYLTQWQKEVLFPGGIDSRYIAGVHVRDEVTGEFDKWIPNPHYDPTPRHAASPPEDPPGGGSSHRAGRPGGDERGIWGAGGREPEMPSWYHGPRTEFYNDSARDEVALYALYERGTHAFLKFGISDDPLTVRYRDGLLREPGEPHRPVDVFVIAKFTHSAAGEPRWLALAAERYLVERWPGDLSHEPWRGRETPPGPDAAWQQVRDLLDRPGTPGGWPATRQADQQFRDDLTTVVRTHVKAAIAERLAEVQADLAGPGLNAVRKAALRPALSVLDAAVNLPVDDFFTVRQAGVHLFEAELYDRAHPFNDRLHGDFAFADPTREQARGAYHRLIEQADSLDLLNQRVLGSDTAAGQRIQVIRDIAARLRDAGEGHTDLPSPTALRDDLAAVDQTRRDLLAQARKVDPAEVRRLLAPGPDQIPALRRSEPYEAFLSWLRTRPGMEPIADIVSRMGSEQYGDWANAAKCVHAALAYEASRRLGQLVTPTELPAQFVDGARSGRELADLASVWSGSRHPGFMELEADQRASALRALSALTKVFKGFGDGARGLVAVGYADGSGHVINVENAGGRVVFPDALDGKLDARYRLQGTEQAPDGKSAVVPAEYIAYLRTDNRNPVPGEIAKFVELPAGATVAQLLRPDRVVPAGHRPMQLDFTMLRRMGQGGAGDLGPGYHSTPDDQEQLHEFYGPRWRAEAHQIREGIQNLTAHIDNLPEEERAQRYALRAALSKIPVEDLVALREYTATAYDPINRALREGDQWELQHWDPVIRCAASALSRLPAHEGLGWRGAGDITPEMVARYQPGALVTEAQFTSAVPHEWGAFEGDFRFVIDSFHGRTASAAAELAFEDELLFAPNTVFKVWAVQQPAQGRPEYTVYMQELPGGDASIPPHPEFIALLPP